MLTESASLATNLDRGERRAEKRQRRRDAAAPYPKREKTLDDEEDEETVEFFAGEKEEQPETKTSGFFARLASYLPLVGKLVNEVEEEVEDVELQPAVDSESQELEVMEEEEEEEVEEEEETQEAEEIEEEETPEDQQEAPMEEETQEKETEKQQTPEDEEMTEQPASPVTRAAPSFVAHQEKEQTPTPKKHKKPSARKERSPSHDSVESNERSPASLRVQRKRGDKRVFLPGPSQQSKMLRISSSQRRRKSNSPAPKETAIAMIKQKKAISYEEYERLAHQLHDLVEPTPQTALALTQTALANGLERPFTRGFPGPSLTPYIPGSIAHPTNGSLVERKRTEQVTKNGVPFGKRPRNHESNPIMFSGASLRGQLTREERLMRKPRPSRLLTGTKRDAAARNAYSAAVAEKILSTLNKVQTPLEREAQKPTPSTSMSWAKYHLSLTEDQTMMLENGKNDDNGDVPPPTATVPRVAFPQSVQKHDAAFASFNTLPKSTFETPASKAKSVGTSAGVTPLFSPQAVSMTPAPEPVARSSAPKSTLASAPEPPKVQKMGQFTFTLPISTEMSKKIDADEEDNRVRFIFSPPPSLREPPVKTSSQKATSKAKANSAAPFDFMPSSPKVKTTEWTSKPPAAKKHETLKVVEKKTSTPKETEQKSSESSVPVASNSAVNPLARFMQLKPGQWKCPGCSVLNEATSAKCPCCETAQPGGAATAKAAAPSAPKPAGTISSSGFSFGIPAADAKKDAEKTSSITSGGFNFGAPTKDTDKPAAGSITSGGFSFGAPVADTKKDDEKAAVGITTGGFSFTSPVEKKDSVKPISGGFTFNASASDTKADAAASTASISFGFTSPAKTDDSGSKKDTASFSFGVPGTSASAPSTTPAGGFTSGAAGAVETPSTNKRKAPESEAPQKEAAPSFSFGATGTSDAAAPKASSAAGFSFGTTTAPKPTSPKESDRPKKRVAVSLGASSSKPESSPSAFSFGGVPKPPAKDTSSPSSFGFGESSSSTKQSENPKETTAPAFSFGGNATEKPTEPKAKESSPPTAGFTFGSSSTSAAATKPSTGRSVSPAPAFGSSLPPPTSTFGAPAFGGPAAGGFGTGPPSSGFRTPSPTPAFGSTPPPAFGAPNANFGAAAPAPAVGGFGAPNAGAFGAPADGGFNMGAAPQHAKGRRILKAKTRTRRTS
ncbi:hypothetical protein JM16_005007 [Phytophthora kernoviae]|uniref:RanBP2-type domain-containing protein n=1 Tax=Phytophthora kernoviae TaxID=325452 RepID=A0A8T0LXZ3_9STRA|nr:hypothetical protein JM16_005007 [Phytophthora kernoviae]